MSESRLLNVPALASYLGITHRAAQSLVYTRRLPVVKVGRHAYVRRDDVDAYITANTEPANPEAVNR